MLTGTGSCPAVGEEVGPVLVAVVGTRGAGRDGRTGNPLKSVRDSGKGVDIWPHFCKGGTRALQKGGRTKSERPGHPFSPGGPRLSRGLLSGVVERLNWGLHRKRNLCRPARRGREWWRGISGPKNRTHVSSRNGAPGSCGEEGG